ncbi:GTP cyclohydrolase II [Amphibiibacter pelophylacis]|uniref:GTP cyclohydrolase II n=1 Tax=Amphibiibacter pelophylacis TaxID=1799477 RepID=A0ACC6P6I4_9BURK
MSFLSDPVCARLPTEWGDFEVRVYTDTRNGTEHMALSCGDLARAREGGVLVRLHSECATGDIFSSQRCDCRPQLVLAQQRIQQEGCGVLVYLRGHEGRGIGLSQKIAAYALQEQGLDTLEANRALGLPVDSRDYSAGIAILQHLGVQRVRLMSNNPRKLQALTDAGLDVVGRVAHQAPGNPHNAAYLDTKRVRMGHLLTPQPDPVRGPV